MRPEHKVILSNAEREVEYSRDFSNNLLSTEETRSLWRAWAGFLEHYVKAVSAMKRATDKGASKGWSDNLLHQQKNDPILQYARQARDHDSHVFEEKREANPRSLSIDNVMRVEGTYNVSFTNVNIIGSGGITSKMLDGTLKTRDGRYVGGTIPRNYILEEEHFIVVTDVKTRSGTWCIPNPDTDPEKRAIEIANYSVKWLEKCLLEAKRLSANEDL